MVCSTRTVHPSSPSTRCPSLRAATERRTSASSNVIGILSFFGFGSTMESECKRLRHARLTSN